MSLSIERLKNDYPGDLQSLFDSENIIIAVCEESLGIPTIAVTDRFMYLCLFDRQGRYDHRKVMSFDASALHWGRELFMHYRKSAREVTDV